jgi:hypothetical protein
MLCGFFAWVDGRVALRLCVFNAVSVVKILLIKI